jgi:hypothetical protein
MTENPYLPPGDNSIGGKEIQQKEVKLFTGPTVFIVGLISNTVSVGLMNGINHKNIGNVKLAVTWMLCGFISLIGIGICGRYFGSGPAIIGYFALLVFGTLMNFNDFKLEWFSGAQRQNGWKTAFISIIGLSSGLVSIFIFSKET